MAEPADINVDELRRRARRRLVGAIVLALGVAVVVPMLLETEQKPLGEDVSVKIPPIDDSKFVNRLTENRAKDAAGTPSKAPPKDEAAKEAAATAPPVAAPTAPPKYDTRIPDAPATSATTPDAGSGATAARPSTPSSASPASDATKASSASAAPRAEGKAAAPSAAAQPAPAVVAAAAKPAATVDAVPHEGFAVQLAAFADDKGANALAGRLKKSGYAAYTEPLKTSKGTLWRVRVGPYPSREAALAARDKLKTEGQSGIVASVK